MSHPQRALRALVSRPSLEQLKKQARELLKAVRAGLPEAEARARAGHPRFSATEVELASFSLSDAQLVLAREYGHPSFPALKADVEARRRARDQVPLSGALPLIELGVIAFCPYSELAVLLEDPRALAAVTVAVASDGLAACTFRPRSPAAAAVETETPAVAALVRVGRVRPGSKGQTVVTLAWLARASVERTLPGTEHDRAAVVARAEPALAEAELRAAAASISEALERLARTREWLSVPELRALGRDRNLGRLLALAAPHCPGLAEDAARRELGLAALVAKVRASLERVASQQASLGAVPPAAPASADAEAKAYLVVLAAGGHPHLSGRRYALGNGITTLGRGEGNDVVLHGDAVSRTHAAVEREGEDFFVVDRGSTNGTFVSEGSEPVARQRLQDGDELRVGDSVLRFLQGDELEAKYRAALDYVSEHDALTRARNRQAWSVDTERAVLGARAEREPLSVLLVQLDDLGAIRDRAGELCGHAALRSVAVTLAELAGPGACVGRYTGEQLALTLPRVDRPSAEAFGADLRRRLEERPFAYGGETLRLRVTLGVSTLYSSTGLCELMEDAESSLRRVQVAKRRSNTAAGETREKRVPG